MTYVWIRPGWYQDKFLDRRLLGLPDFSSLAFLSFGQFLSLPFNTSGAYNSTCLYVYQIQHSHKKLKCATDPSVRVKCPWLSLEHALTMEWKSVSAVKRAAGLHKLWGEGRPSLAAGGGDHWLHGCIKADPYIEPPGRARADQLIKQ